MKPNMLEIAAPRRLKIGINIKPIIRFMKSDKAMIPEYFNGDFSNFRTSKSSAPIIAQTHAGRRQIINLIPEKSTFVGETSLAGKILLKTKSDRSKLAGTPIQIKKAVIGHDFSRTDNLAKKSPFFEPKSGKAACLIDLGTARPDRITNQGILK